MIALPAPPPHPSRPHRPGRSRQGSVGTHGTHACRSRLMNDPEVAIMPGACVHAGLDEMLQQTHDGLLAEINYAPHTPVQWRTVRGTKGLAALEALYADDKRPHIEPGLNQFRAFFAEHGEDAVLVVASCEVTP